MATVISRPEAGEHAEYYSRYTTLVTGGDALVALRSQVAETLETLDDIPESREGYRYEPGKWSIREVVGHMIDTERIFAYRALRFSRADATPLPGFEQDDYVRNGPYDQCALADLAAEFAAVRQASICQFRNLGPEALERRGFASIGDLSVRAAAWIIAGHELHHMRILRERYMLV